MNGAKLLSDTFQVPANCTFKFKKCTAQKKWTEVGQE